MEATPATGSMSKKLDRSLHMSRPEFTRKNRNFFSKRWSSGLRLTPCAVHRHCDGFTAREEDGETLGSPQRRLDRRRQIEESWTGRGSIAFEHEHGLVAP